MKLLLAFAGLAQVVAQSLTQPSAASSPTYSPTPAPKPAYRRLQEEVNKDELNRDLHSAILHGDTATAESLLSQGANIDDVTQSGPRWSPLAEAAVHRMSSVCLWLLTKKASPDIIDNRGRTPLYHAVHYSMKDVVTEMVKTAKHFSAHDGDNVDMLTRAVWQEDSDIVQILLTAGATSTAAEVAAAHAPWSIQKLFGITTVTTTAAPVTTSTPAPATTAAPTPATTAAPATTAP